MYNEQHKAFASFATPAHHLGLWDIKLRRVDAQRRDQQSPATVEASHVPVAARPAKSQLKLF